MDYLIIGSLQHHFDSDSGRPGPMMAVITVFQQRYLWYNVNPPRLAAVSNIVDRLGRARIWTNPRVGGLQGLYWGLVATLPFMGSTTPSRRQIQLDSPRSASPLLPPGFREPHLLFILFCAESIEIFAEFKIVPRLVLCSLVLSFANAAHSLAWGEPRSTPVNEAANFMGWSPKPTSAPIFRTPQKSHWHGQPMWLCEWRSEYALNAFQLEMCWRISH